MEKIEVNIEAMKAEAPFALVELVRSDRRETPIRIFKDHFLKIYNLLGRDVRINELTGLLDGLQTHRLSVTDGRHQESCERYDYWIEQVEQELDILMGLNEVEFPATNILTLHRLDVRIWIADRPIITYGYGEQLEVVNSFDELSHKFVPVICRLLGSDKICRTGKHGCNI